MKSEGDCTAGSESSRFANGNFKKLFTLKMGGNGLALARNASSWYSSSAPVKVVSPFLPSTSTWTVLAELGDLASMDFAPGMLAKKSECQALAEASVLLTSCNTQEPCLI
jgi:hypothetical protein